MPKEELEIVISATGKVRARLVGAKGKACDDMAKLLARIVGREESRELTGEHYACDEHEEHHLDVKQRRNGGAL
jgi:hypothetical protein